LENRANRLIGRASIASAVIGVALSPLPFADEIVLGGIHVELARRVGKLHGLGLLRIPWRPIGLTVAKGLVARGFVNFGLSFIPIVDGQVSYGEAVGTAFQRATRREASPLPRCRKRVPPVRSVLSWGMATPMQRSGSENLTQEC